MGNAYLREGVKNILITGATGGIGGELVKKFVLLGGNVLGTGTNSEKLDKIKKQHSTIKVKKFDLDTNYFSKKEGDVKKEITKN